eukprot:TRINITY_DN11773_c0_g1_i2.p1 TRINITY_DN11773_c0_g1~~TRINITY_DN11773_c0_g1_i2.p1  ORF type:complete len:517 (+),score=174.48 TRINITY_DN11773_c0_g1_i2:40-1590(+)
MSHDTEAPLDPITAAWHAVRQRHHLRNFLCFIALGCINNYHYCVVIAGAKAVADGFGLKSLMALITWAVIAGGAFVRFLNAFVLMHWTYNKKYLYAVAMTLGGLGIACVAPYCGDINGLRFAVFLIGVLLIGCGSSFGEQTSLALMDSFPAKTIGGWSSGTGMSGVAASLVFLGLQNLDLSTSLIYALQIPFVLVYCMAYYAGVVLVPRVEVTVAADGEPSFTPVKNWARKWGNVDSAQLLTSDPEPANAHSVDADALAKYDHEATWSAFRRWVHRRAPAFPYEAVRRCNTVIAFQGVNLFLVYIFEYAIQMAAPNVFPDLSTLDSANVTAEAAGGCATSKGDFDFFTQNAFVVSQFCYQLGVLLSRSSLGVVRISRVEVLTALQGVNFVCWVALAKVKALQTLCDVDEQRMYTGIWMAWMVFVGLMGGASYVNCYFNILNKDYLSEQLDSIARLENAKQAERRAARGQAGGEAELAPRPCNARELAMNVGALYQTVGVMLGSLVCLVLQNTLLDH